MWRLCFAFPNDVFKWPGLVRMTSSLLTLRWNNWPQLLLTLKTYQCPVRMPRNPSLAWWFSGTLKYYHRRSSHSFQCYEKTKSNIHYATFSCFQKSIKVTTKLDRQRQNHLMTLLKFNLIVFWKYVSNFKMKYNSLIQLRVDNQIFKDSKSVAEYFANYFKSIVNTTYLAVTHHSVTLDRWYFWCGI
jgi:hypothetical protein